MWFWFLRFHVGQFFSFPHWREDDHTWNRALQHSKAFCENFLFFSTCFAVSWVIVNEYWSKASNFQIFQKQSFFSKIIMFGHFHAFWPKIIIFKKILIFGGGPNRPFLVIFIVYSPCFWTKNHQNYNIPKIIFGPKSTLFNDHKSWNFGQIHRLFVYNFYQRK